MRIDLPVEVLLDDLQHNTFEYFQAGNQSHNGLVEDKSSVRLRPNHHAIGSALASYPVAS